MGTIAFSDVDLTDTHTASAAFTSSSYAGGQLGSLTASVTTDTTGTGTGGEVTWNYSVDDSAVQFLGVGDSITETYTVTLTDGETGGTVTRDVVVTITGTNDPAVIGVADVAGSVTEGNGTPTARTDMGTIAFSDVDLTDTHSASAAFTSSSHSDGQLGSLTASVTTDTTGAGTGGEVTWNYSVDDAAVQFLGVGDSITETYTVTLADGETGGAVTRDVVVTITGTNDAPDIRASGTDTTSAELDEANAGLTTSGTLTIVDVDTSDTVSTSFELSQVTGSTGELTEDQLEAMFSLAPETPLAADSGDAHNLTWAFNSGAEVFDYLAPGESLQLSYTLTSSDGHGGIDTQVVTVTISGTNDAPALTGDLSAALAEGGSYVLTGADLGFADPDDGASDVTFTATGLTNGSLLVDGSAATTFTGQQLADGLVSFVHDGSETTSATFSISVEDGNEDSSPAVAQPFNFVVTPVNDAPVNALPESFTTDEDMSFKLSGLSVADADAASGTISVTLSVSAGALLAASSAGVTVTGSNSESIVLSGSVAAINAYLLSASSQPTYVPAPDANGSVQLTMTTDDAGNSGSGGAKSDIDLSTINITAVNDAALFTGDEGGDIVEDAVPNTVAGDLDSTDVDGEDDSFVAVTTAAASDSGYGSFTVTADGQWVYTLDNGNADVNELFSFSQFLEDSFTVTAADGTTKTINITIFGNNDPATITGDITGNVTEATGANPGTPSASGTLHSTDPDGTADAFFEVTSPIPSVNGYGSFTVTSSGVWTYMLDNTDTTVDGLNNGDTLSDSFLVHAQDGTAQLITVTIGGATDAIIVPAVYNGDEDPNNFDTKNDLGGQNDTLIIGTNGNDSLNGTTGADTIRALDGDDTVNAGRNGDTVYGGSGADTINGGDGNDFLYGQAGNDIIHGDGNNDTIYGGSGDDQIFGDDNSDQTLYGGSGSDTISGGNNSDRIAGGFGADTLSGGSNGDTFVYFDLRDTGDTITDFDGGDRIDFSAIDADPLMAGDQGFAFGGTTATAHGVWYDLIEGNTVVYLDSDGDAATAELAITLTGEIDLHQTDFLLGP
jgi:VCBS repeat-containing protein